MIVEFKTDRLGSDAEVGPIVERLEYDLQVRRYSKAVETELGIQPKLLLVFLNVGGATIKVAEIEP